MSNLDTGEEDTMKKMVKGLADHLGELVLVAGAAAVAVGAGLICLPAGLITGGALAIVGAVISILGDGGASEGGDRR